jgi:hypothetical protein
MKAFVPCLALLLVGCIHKPSAQHLMGAVPGAVQAPPPNPALVSSCETTRTWHNIWVLSGTVFGALGGAGGTADAISTDKNFQTGVDVGLIAAGVLGAISSGAAGITADTYSTDNCAQILQQAANASVVAAPQ